MADKLTTRIVQDGLEINWEREVSSSLNAEEAAKLSVDAITALQKFKDTDPRTQPELRKKKKESEEQAKAVRWISWGFVIGVVVMSFGVGDCDGRVLEHRQSYAYEPGINYGTRGGCN